jgi:hypothetical protein
MYQLQGKITVPTITIAATADHITPPGAVSYLINQYNAAVSSGTATIRYVAKYLESARLETTHSSRQLEPELHQQLQQMELVTATTQLAKS